MIFKELFAITEGENYKTVAKENRREEYVYFIDQ